MPDITPPEVFVPGDVAEAARVSRNLYRSGSTPDTFEVINGRLSEENLDTVDIERRMVRARSFITALTRGATANTDFYEEFYRGDWDINALFDLPLIGTVGAFSRSLVIPGTGLTYTVDWEDCQGVYLAWHIGLVVDAGYILDAGVLKDKDGNNVAGVEADNLVTLHIDDFPVAPLSRKFKHGDQSMVFPETPGDPLRNDSVQVDARWWSGHMILDRVNSTTYVPPGNVQPWVKGHHTADLRLASKNPHIRFKTRRMTAIPIR